MGEYRVPSPLQFEKVANFRGQNGTVRKLAARLELLQSPSATHKALQLRVRATPKRVAGPRLALPLSLPTVGADPSARRDA